MSIKYHKHQSFLQVDAIKNSKFSISVQYLKKNVKDEIVFCLQINVKGFFKLILSFKVGVARYVEITQNSKFAISWQYSNKGT